MSTIYYNQQREYSDKLVKFVILLSQYKLDRASQLLPEFRAKHYFNHLQRLLKNLHQAELAEKELVVLKFTIKQLKSKNGNTNFKTQQNKQYKSSFDVSCETQIIRLMENDSLYNARRVAQIHKRTALQQIIHQVMEYRYIKQQIHSSQIINKSIQLSKQGRRLTKIIEDYVKLKEQINGHLKESVKNCLADQPINLLPQDLFLPDFRHQFQTLIKTFREMKDQVYNYKSGMRQKVENVAKQFALDWKYNRQQDFMDSFIDILRPQLQSPKKVVNLTSTLAKNGKQNNFEQDCNPTKARIITFGKSQRVSFKKTVNLYQSKSLKPQLLLPLNMEEKVNQINEVLEPHSKDQFYSLSLIQKLTAIQGKVRQLCDKQKKEDQTFIYNMLSLIDDNNQLPETNERQNSDRQLISNDKEYVQYIQKQNSTLERIVQTLTKQRDQAKKLSQTLKQRLRQQNANENSSFISQQHPQNSEEQIQRLSKQMNRLRGELGQRSNSLKLYQEQKQQYKKQIKTLKSNYGKLQKKHKQLQQELDEQLHQVEILHQICQQRQLLQQTENNKNKPILTESTVRRFDILQKRNMALAQQNERLQQLKKGPNTTQIAIGSSQVYDQSIDQNIIIGNGSFIQSMRVQEPKVDPQTYIDRINELQYQIELLTLQLHKKDESIESLSKKCLELKGSGSQLQKQNHELAHKLDIIDIRNLTHNKDNVHNIHLFPPGFIFNQYDHQERKFLLDSLFSYVGPIRSTRLLYRADPFNKVNFHNYIDKHQHVVLICKTVYGKLIAGYSAQAFDAKGIQKGRGMILSLWSRMVFTVKDKKAISYDDYYIIYGNSELRVRSLQFKLFSNFGIANAYYDNNGHKVDVILGEGGERQVDLSEYQVYALDLWE